MVEKKDETVKNVAVSAGAVAGGTAALAGVYAGGTVGITSAVAMTSGLAAVGGVIGGGMLAGICVVAAAPIAGGLAAFGAFKLFKRLASR